MGSIRPDSGLDSHMVEVVASLDQTLNLIDTEVVPRAIVVVGDADKDQVFRSVAVGRNADVVEKRMIVEDIVGTALVGMGAEKGRWRIGACKGVVGSGIVVVGTVFAAVGMALAVVDMAAEHKTVAEVAPSGQDRQPGPHSKRPPPM